MLKRFPSLHRLKVLTHQTVGLGTPIGLQLRQLPDAQLTIGGSVPAAHHEEVQSLSNQCGHLHVKERPRMEEVLKRVDSILRELSRVPTRPVPTSPVHDTRVESTPHKLNGVQTQSPASPAYDAQAGSVPHQQNSIPTPALVPPVYDAKTDRLSLVALFHAANGPPDKKEWLGLVKKGGWSKRGGWGRSAPLRKWEGVSVDGRGRAQRLELSKNNLTGECGRSCCMVDVTMGRSRDRPDSDGSLSCRSLLAFCKHTLRDTAKQRTRATSSV